MFDVKIDLSFLNSSIDTKRKEKTKHRDRVKSYFFEVTYSTFLYCKRGNFRSYFASGVCLQRGEEAKKGDMKLKEKKITVNVN